MCQSASSGFCFENPARYGSWPVWITGSRQSLREEKRQGEKGLGRAMTSPVARRERATALEHLADFLRGRAGFDVNQSGVPALRANHCQHGLGSRRVDEQRAFL